MRTVLAVLCLFLGTTAPVLHAGPDHPPDLHGSFHAISVQNLDRMIAWYTRTLGFELESSAENEQRRGALLTRGDIILELAQFEGAVGLATLDADRDSHLVLGVFKLGFLTPDLDHTFERIKATDAEVFFPIVNAAGGQRTFGVKDAEGNIVQFFGE